MSRYLDMPPSTTESNALLHWLQNVYDAITLLENFVVTTVDAAKTLLPEESGLILLANTTAFTITLPKVSVCGDGLKYLFIKSTSDAEIITLDGAGSETINGSATNTDIDAQYDRIGIVSTSNGWLIYERFIS